MESQLRSHRQNDPRKARRDTAPARIQPMGIADSPLSGEPLGRPTRHRRLRPSAERPARAVSARPVTAHSLRWRATTQQPRRCSVGLTAAVAKSSSSRGQPPGDSKAARASAWAAPKRSRSRCSSSTRVRSGPSATKRTSTSVSKAESKCQVASICPGQHQPRGRLPDQHAAPLTLVAVSVDLVPSGRPRGRREPLASGHPLRSCEYAAPAVDGHRRKVRHVVTGLRRVPKS